MIAVREEHAPSVIAPAHPVVQVGLIRLVPQAAGDGEAVQVRGQGWAARVQRVEHHPDPEPPGRVASALVEAMQSRVERWRCQAGKLPGREGEFEQTSPQRHQRRIQTGIQREPAEIGVHTPPPLLAGSRMVAIEGWGLDVDPVQRRLIRRPGGGFTDGCRALQHNFDFTHRFL